MFIFPSSFGNRNGSRNCVTLVASSLRLTLSFLRLQMGGFPNTEGCGGTSRSAPLCLQADQVHAHNPEKQSLSQGVPPVARMGDVFCVQFCHFSAGERFIVLDSEINFLFFLYEGAVLIMPCPISPFFIRLRLSRTLPKSQEL